MCPTSLLTKTFFSLLVFYSCFGVSVAMSGTVATGFYHSCAINASGGVQCWGMNTNGQLGDGTTIQRLTPVVVTGLGSGVISIVAGANFTCALTNSGGIQCWGTNTAGQLGDGTATQRLTPVSVTGLSSGITSITASGGHVCALSNQGRAYCWGTGSGGRLGDGSGADRLSPVVVSGLTSGTVAISAGNQHSCAVKNDGAAYCWGYNDTGQLGDATIINSSVPVQVSGLPANITNISAGSDHSCAITNTGSVY